MTVGTLGIYTLFWFYKNWNAEQQNTGEMLNPAVRGLFAPIYCHSFLLRVKHRAESAKVSLCFSPTLVTGGYVLMSVCAFSDTFFPVFAFSALPMLPLQKAVQRINAAQGLDSGSEARFRAINVIGLALAGAFYLMVILGLLMPPPG